MNEKMKVCPHCDGFGDLMEPLSFSGDLENYQLISWDCPICHCEGKEYGTEMTPEQANARDPERN